MGTHKDILHYTSLRLMNLTRLISIGSKPIKVMVVVLVIVIVFVKKKLEQKHFWSKEFRSKKIQAKNVNPKKFWIEKKNFQKILGNKKCPFINN